MSRIDSIIPRGLVAEVLFRLRFRCRSRSYPLRDRVCQRVLWYRSVLRGS